MPAHQPTVVGRGLGGELRALRMERKLSTRKMAERLGWPQSKMSKIENGRQRITPPDVASLLTVYEVTGPDRDRLIARAETSDESGLWENQDGLSSESRTLMQLEAEATRIFNLEPLWLPGLVQMPDYTRAVMEACMVSAEDVEIRVSSRLSRQALLSRQDPPHVEFVIDESSLRRQVVPSRLMSRQLRHIIETAERSSVTVQVLPLSLGAHNGLDGPFMLMEFARLPTVIHVEHKISAFFMEGEREAAYYRKEADTLREIALNPAESADCIATIAREFDREG